jgi:hypothetical protein
VKRIDSMPAKGGTQLDYARLFDGKPWKLERADFGGRTAKAVSAAIRNAAHRQGLSVSIFARDGGLYVQARPQRKRRS